LVAPASTRGHGTQPVLPTIKTKPTFFLGSARRLGAKNPPPMPSAAAERLISMQKNSEQKGNIGGLEKSGWVPVEGIGSTRPQGRKQREKGPNVENVAKRGGKPGKPALPTLVKKWARQTTLQNPKMRWPVKQLVTKKKKRTNRRRTTNNHKNTAGGKSKGRGGTASVKNTGPKHKKKKFETQLC